MGFSSHLSALRIRDKLNEKYLKKGSYFRLKKKFLEASVKEGLSLKSATPSQLEHIKKKIREQRKEENKKQKKIILFSIIFGLLLFYTLGYLLQVVFFP